MNRNVGYMYGQAVALLALYLLISVCLLAAIWSADDVAARLGIDQFDLLLGAAVASGLLLMHPAAYARWRADRLVRLQRETRLTHLVAVGWIMGVLAVRALFFQAWDFGLAIAQFAFFCTVFNAVTAVLPTNALCRRLEAERDRLRGIAPA